MDHEKERTIKDVIRKISAAHDGNVSFNDTIKDSDLCGMSLNEFYKTLVSIVFPGYTIFYAEDTRESKQLDYSPDDIGAMLYSARMFGTIRTYYIGNGLSEAIPIPEFTIDDQRCIDGFHGIDGVSYRPYSKHPLYVKAECLARVIRVVDDFTRFAAHDILRPYRVIEGLSPWLQYRTEIFSDLAVTVIKWLTAHIGSDNQNVFVDYLANEECYHELYVELVQFIHEHLTQQDNTAKFEL